MQRIIRVFFSDIGTGLKGSENINDEIGKGNAQHCGACIPFLSYAIETEKTGQENMTCRERALSEDYFEIITDFQVTQELLDGAVIDMCTIPAGQGVYVSYVNREVPPGRNGNPLYFTPQCYGLMAEPSVENDTETGMRMQQGGSAEPAVFDTFALTNTGIRQTQLPPLSLTGRGVVLGFLDTGIRYENSAFRYSDGSSRIMAIWDQTIQTGKPPQGQIFGTEYKREEIDAALINDNPRALVPTTDEVGHGTAIASVAAGSAAGAGGAGQSGGTGQPGSAGQTAAGVTAAGWGIGAAPDADIVVVKLREAKQYLRKQQLIPEDAHAYAESDILLALKYLNGFAISLRRPLVVCFGLGTNMRSHTGNSILSRYMQNMLEKRSRAIVVCGGNEGNSAHHFEGHTCIRQGDAYEDAEVRVTEGVKGFMAEIWGIVPQLYTVSVISPSGEMFPTGSGLIGQNLHHNFLYEKTKLDIIYNVQEEGSGDERILLRFEEPTAGIWTIRVYGVGECTKNLFHIWLPIRNFLTADTYFLRPTPYVTLTVPAYAEEVISVTTYNDENNSFWIESGRGFGRGGEIKPDLAAPGVDIPTAVGRMSGSSMAAALTAGAAAQFLQWAVVERNDEYVFGREVRNYLIRGATREDNLTYPNREWGFGRLNIAGTFEALRRLR